MTELTNINTIRELVEFSKKEYNRLTAFTIKENRQYITKTYVDFSEDIKKTAQKIAEYKLIGKAIALIGSNCYEWCTAYFGILYAGAIAVPLDNHLPPNELAGLLKRSEAQMIIYDKRHGNTVQASSIQFKFDFDEYKSFLKDGAVDTNTAFSEIDENAPAILMFTSGTTSASKGVLLSQKNILSNTKDMASIYHFNKQDVYLSLLPLHHAFGSGAMVLFTALGIRTVFAQGLRIAQALSEYKVKILVCVPAILDAMKTKITHGIKKQNKTAAFNFMRSVSRLLYRLKIDCRRKFFKSILDMLGGNLDFIICGAAAADNETLSFFNDIGINVIQGYGLTETSPVLSAERLNKTRSGSVGFALPSVKISIDNPGENGIGEIVASGPNVMLGYFNDNEATAAVLKDGKFYTGDMGHIDSDGYLYINGRKKNVIVLKNGKNVFPEELEELISAIPGVSENIVHLNVSENKEILGVKIVYNTDLFENETEAQTKIRDEINLLNKKLVSYKQIRNIELTDKPFPKTTTLKIKRNEI